jgi:hypothetical protein
MEENKVKENLVQFHWEEGYKTVNWKQFRREALNISFFLFKQKIPSLNITKTIFREKSRDMRSWGGCQRKVESIIYVCISPHLSSYIGKNFKFNVLWTVRRDIFVQ